MNIINQENIVIFKKGKRSIKTNHKIKTEKLNKRIKILKQIKKNRLKI